MYVLQSLATKHFHAHIALIKEFVFACFFIALTSLSALVFCLTGKKFEAHNTSKICLFVHKSLVSCKKNADEIVCKQCKRCCTLNERL